MGTPGWLRSTYRSRHEAVSYARGVGPPWPTTAAAWHGADQPRGKEELRGEGGIGGAKCYIHRSCTVSCAVNGRWLET